MIKAPRLDGTNKVPVAQLGDGGIATDFLRKDRTWANPGAGSTNIKQVEVDFGVVPKSEASFVIVDVDVSVGSHIIGSVAYEAPTGKDLDELEMDSIDLKFAPGAGQLTIYIIGLLGYLHDKFKINYLVG